MKMLRILVLVVVVLLFLTDEAEAQRFRGGFTLGLNVSQVDGDEIYGFRKYGFHGGAVGTVPLKKNLLFTLETLYSRKGAFQPKSTLYYRQYRIELDYVEVPFILQYNDKDIFTIGAGFAFGRLVEVKEWEKGERTSTNLYGENSHYSRNDLLVLIDLKFRIIKRFSMNVRYQYSIIPVRTAVFTDDFQQKKWERRQYNNILTFRVAYMFNEPLPEKD